MKMSRRLVMGLAAVAAVSLALAGCVSTESTSSTDSKIGKVDTSLTKAPASAEVGTPTKAICQGKTYRIGVNIYSTGNTFGKDVIDGAQKIAKSLGCVKLVVLTDEFDAQKVVPNVQSLVQQKVDAVALLTATAAPFQQALSTAQDAGLPVATAVIQGKTATLADVDFEAGGAEGGAGVAKAFKSKYPGKTPYVVLGEYNEGGPALVDRMTGVQKSLKAAFPDLTDKMIFHVATQADPTTAGQGALSALSLVPVGSPIVVVGMNDDIGYAMLQSVKGAGWNALGLGHGGDSNGHTLVCSGDFFTDGWFPEKTFDYIIPILIGELHGQNMPARITTKTAFLSSSTVNTYYPGTCK